MRPSVISSSHNPNVKRWRRLLEARGIEQFGQCVISGERLVREVMALFPQHCREIILSPKKTIDPPFPSWLTSYSVPPPVFEQLDMFGTRFPLLICQIPDFPVMDLNQSPVGLELLCPLGDPVNVGAVVRTAVAMGVDKIILLRESANPFHPKAIRTGSGAMFSASFFKGPPISEVPSTGSIVGLDLTGSALSTFSWPKNVRMVVGEEGQGTGLLELGKRVTIPISGTINSLNATIAVGMALYAYRVQYPLKGEKKGSGGHQAVTRRV